MCFPAPPPRSSFILLELVMDRTPEASPILLKLRCGYWPEYNRGRTWPCECRDRARAHMSSTDEHGRRRCPFPVESVCLHLYSWLFYVWCLACILLDPFWRSCKWFHRVGNECQTTTASLPCFSFRSFKILYAWVSSSSCMSLPRVCAGAHRARSIRSPGSWS